jgi:hypothetical protein
MFLREDPYQLPQLSISGARRSIFTILISSGGPKGRQAVGLSPSGPLHRGSEKPQVRRGERRLPGEVQTGPEVSAGVSIRAQCLTRRNGQVNVSDQIRVSHN